MLDGLIGWEPGRGKATKFYLTKMIPLILKKV